MSPRSRSPLTLALSPHLPSPPSPPPPFPPPPPHLPSPPQYNSYENFLQEINRSSLRARRINDMLKLVFLALNNAAPSYISDLLTER